jgi:hypothetical protein
VITDSGWIVVTRKLSRRVLGSWQGNVPTSLKLLKISRQRMTIFWVPGIRPGAIMRQVNGRYRGALHIVAGVMLVSAVLPVFVSPPHETPLDSSSRMPESQYSKNAGAGSPRPAD